MSVSLTLPFPPSLNNLFVNGSRGRFPSQKYETWKTEAGWILQQQRPQKLKGPVGISLVFQDAKDGRQRDLDNLLKASLDLLVEHRVIEGDHSKIVRRLDAAWSKEVEGVCISILPHEAQS